MDGMTWRTSSYSGETSMCVEVAAGPGRVRIRDTKDRSRGMLAVGGSAWELFLRALPEVYP